MSAAVPRDVHAPSLDSLAADPTLAITLPKPEAVRLLAQVGAVEAVLRACVAAPAENGELPESGGHEMLTAEQAARRTGMSARWLYARAKAGELPFARRFGRSWRFSAHGIDRWKTRQRP